jgi:SET domain-containing protein
LQPKLWDQNSVKIVAMKNIRRGEEVTFDYSTSESENGWYGI